MKFSASDRIIISIQQLSYMLNLEVLFLPGLPEWPQTSASKLTVFRCYTLFFQLFILEKISTLIFNWYFISVDQKAVPSVSMIFHWNSKEDWTDIRQEWKEERWKRNLNLLHLGFFQRKKKSEKRTLNMLTSVRICSNMLYRVENKTNKTNPKLSSNNKLPTIFVRYTIRNNSSFTSISLNCY